MTRFIQTSDLQLGMGLSWLGPEAQPRWQQARIDAIRKIGDVAREHDAQFVVAAGDVFDASIVDPHTVARTCDALATIEVPVYLLPGNHDPLDGNTIYRSARWVEAKPKNVHVVTSTEPIHVPGTNAELIGAPWHSKRPGRDLNNEALTKAGDVPAGMMRILLGHGQPVTISPDTTLPELVQMEPLLEAQKQGRVHHVALGDRHSTMDVDGHGFVWFSGAPEVTDWRDPDPGNVLIVDLELDTIPQVRPVRVGTWTMDRQEVELSDEASVAAIDTLLAGYDSPTTAAVQLVVRGAISLGVNEAFEKVLHTRGPALAKLHLAPKHDHRLRRPTPDDLERLDLRGYAKDALDELAAAAAGGDDPVADEAIVQLFRIETEVRS